MRYDLKKLLLNNTTNSFEYAFEIMKDGLRLWQAGLCMEVNRHVIIDRKKETEGAWRMW